MSKKRRKRESLTTLSRRAMARLASTPAWREVIQAGREVLPRGLVLCRKCEHCYPRYYIAARLCYDCRSNIAPMYVSSKWPSSSPLVRGAA